MISTRARGASGSQHRRARLLPFDPEKLIPSVYQFSRPPGSAEPTREAIGEADRVRCFTNANVLKLATSPDAGRVTHVEVGHVAGNRFA